MALIVVTFLVVPHSTETMDLPRMFARVDCVSMVLPPERKLVTIDEAIRPLSIMRHRTTYTRKPTS